MSRAQWIRAGLFAGLLATGAAAVEPRAQPTARPAGTEPPARYGHSLTAVEGTPYLFGGIGGERAEAYNDLWRYDPTGNTWSELGPGQGPAARWAHAAAVGSGRMFVFFGWDAEGTAVDDIWAFDPAAGSWATVAPQGPVLPSADADFVAAAHRDGIYLLEVRAGRNGLWLFDPDTAAFTVKAAPPASLSAGTSLAAIGRWLFAYGDCGAGCADNLWKYDSFSNTWSAELPLGDRPPARSYHAAVSTGEFLWILGGKSSGQTFGDAWRYDPFDEVWERHQDLAAPRAMVQAALLAGDPNPEFLLFGGFRGGTVLAETERYSPCALSCAASAAPASGQAPLAVTFAAQVDSGGCWGAADTLWKFGDGSTGAGLAIVHTYAVAGRYDWEFTATLGARTCARSGVILVSSQCPDAPEPSPRQGHSLVVVEGAAYLFGGSGGSRAAPYNDLWRYDPAQDWLCLDPVGPPSPRFAHAAAGAGGRMLVFYGRDTLGAYLSDIWAYDTGLGTWEPIAPQGLVLPPPGAAYEAASREEGVYLLGQSAVSNSVWLLQPEGATFLQKAPPPPSLLPGASLAAAVGLLFAFGECTGGGADNLWKYDPQTDSWSAVHPPGDLPAPRSRHAAASSGQSFWIFGGEASGQDLKDVWEFDAGLGTWERRGDLPAARSGAKAAALQGERSLEFLLFGGARGGTPLADTLRYAPCTLSCAASASPSIGRAPLTVAFRGEAFATNCSEPVQTSWSFGEGREIEAETASHTYARPGTYAWRYTASADGETCARDGLIEVSPGIPGDADGNGMVSIGEVQQAINQFLGNAPPGPLVDCDGDGVVAIGEVQKVINAFLDAAGSC